MLAVMTFVFRIATIRSVAGGFFGDLIREHSATTCYKARYTGFVRLDEYQQRSLSQVRRGHADRKNRD